MSQTKNKGLTLHAIVHRLSLLMALESSLIVICAYYAGYSTSALYHFSNPLIAGLWCVISAILVTQVLIHETIKAGWFRITGSFIGSLSSGILATLFGYHVWVLGICIFVTVATVALLNIKQTFRLASLTAAIVIIVGIVNPAIPSWLNASARFVESVLGVAIATIFVLIFLPLRKRYNLMQSH